MSSVWQITDHTAQLQTAALRGSIDLWNPAGGLRVEEVTGERADGFSLLGILIAPLTTREQQAALECFVRGDDLVARYAETDERPFRAEVYWRFGLPAAAPTSPLATIDLIVSVQTRHLEIDSALAVCSTLPADGRRPMPSDAATAPGRFLFRPNGRRFSYIEMVHPADYRESAVVAAEATGAAAKSDRVTHRLFARRLEKGVILRSRIRGMFVPRDQDVALSDTEFARFAASEPPLTA